MLVENRFSKLHIERRRENENERMKIGNHAVEEVLRASSWKSTWTWIYKKYSDEFSAFSESLALFWWGRDENISAKGEVSNFIARAPGERQQTLMLLKNDCDVKCVCKSIN